MEYKGINEQACPQQACQELSVGKAELRQWGIYPPLALRHGGEELDTANPVDRRIRLQVSRPVCPLGGLAAMCVLME
ncbi:hypothetical protein GCM10027164_24170 [Algoriphagus taiwanensis]